MPPDKGGMARAATIILLAITGTLALQGSVNPLPELAKHEHGDPWAPTSGTKPANLNLEQRELVELAEGRFEAQGLKLPEIDYVFHADLRTCSGHKGMYHKSTRTLEMCSMDMNTMLHELAHAWANENLTEAAKEQFVSLRGLDSWSNHDHAWERRGTEHVAETIAWALAIDPHHVKWVEEAPDGSRQTTHRILTIGVDVDTLLDNFRRITGMGPVFRHTDEWAVDEPASTAISPESRRFEG